MEKNRRNKKNDSLVWMNKTITFFVNNYFYLSSCLIFFKVSIKYYYI